MIDAYKYIDDFVKLVYDPKRNDSYTLDMDDRKDLADIIFNAIRVAIDTVSRYGNGVDICEVNKSQLPGIAKSLSFPIITNEPDGKYGVLMFTIRKYTGNLRILLSGRRNRDYIPFSLTAELFNGEKTWSIHYKRNANRLKKILNYLSWRLDHELSDEEKCILFMSNLGQLKEFLSFKEEKEE